MRIENIIEDIIRDILEIRNEVEEQIKRQDPAMNFSLCLPEIERLSAIRLIELSVREGNEVSTFRAEIHAQNGYRVFAHNYRQAAKDKTTGLNMDHPLQHWFIEILRDTIKKRKLRLQAFQKLHSIKGE